MSGNSITPTFTIEVGSAGQFNNDADVDISSVLNAELAAAPSGDQIKVVFNPGDYGVMNTILLPSNTTVIGNGAELGFLPGANGGSPNGSALISNAATYYISNNTYLQNPNGTYTEVPYTKINTARVATTYAVIIMNTNISVSGLVFNETGSTTDGDSYTDVDGNTFGTWFTNATNIDVSNNVYIGGNDGNAFVNVQNGVVADNIAIGNLCAFDNWNGSSDITIDDNQVWQKSINDNSAFAAVQVNSSPNGNPLTGGDVTNDAVIGDSFAGNTIWQSAVNSDPLLDHGMTSETQITEEGNIDTSLGGYTQGFYSSGPISDLEVADNVVTGAVVPESQQGLIDAVGSGVENATLTGNLIYGASVATPTSAVILAASANVSVTDNASVAESIDGTAEPLVTNATTTNGQITPTATDSAWIEVPANIMVTGQAQTITGVSLENISSDASLTLTVTAQFGTVSTTNSDLSSETNSSNQSMISFTGDETQINQDLSTLVYMPTVGNDTDTIEFVISDQSGVVTTSYIPVINQSLLSTNNNVVTIGSGFISPSDQYNAIGVTGDTATPPPLQGDILIASSGNNVLDMTSLVSQVYLGTGNSTVIGGSVDEYIAAGAGNSWIDLMSGGNVTFAGSSGSSTINALAGDDLIEAGSGSTEVFQGNNTLSVIGGLGTLNIQGGSSNSFITTLPENGGDLTAQLGSGNSTVEAMSGNDDISTEVGTNNLIVLGLGEDSVTSSGDDLIYAGTGTDTINISSGSTGSVIGDGGTVVLVDGGLSVTFLDNKNVILPLTGLADALSSDTVNFSVGEIYDSSSPEILLSKQTLNMVGNDEALIYAANQDTVNINGQGNTLILAPNSTIPRSSSQASMVGGSSIINVNGYSVALIETPGNSISGSEGAQFIVAGGDNVITGYGIEAQVSGAGNKISLTGSDTIISSNPYSYETTNMPLLVQNQMTVQSGQFTLGGLDNLDQTNGSATINLFGGNKVTLNGSDDSVVASDQIYGGNSLINNGLDNSINVVNMENSSTTITANQSTLININDNDGKMTGATNNNNTNENLTFIAGTGTSNTIFGADSNASITLFGGQSFGNIVYGGKLGGSLFNGGSGGMDEFIGGGNGDLLIGGSSGQNTLVAGTGSETLLGSGLATDAFSIGGGGADVIENFAGSLTVNSALSVLAKTDIGGSLVIMLTDNTKLTFLGMANVSESGNVFTLG